MEFNLKKHTHNAYDNSKTNNNTNSNGFEPIAEGNIELITREDSIRN